MSRTTSLPPLLRGRVFTRAEALSAGMTPRKLRGPSVRRIHRGVYADPALPLTLPVLVAADLLHLPDDVALSHTTALAWYGLSLRPDSPRHYSTNTASQIDTGDVVLHRRLGPLHPALVRSVPVLGPDRTLVDCATLLSPREIVRAGDHLVRHGLTTPEHFADYAYDRHLNGVVRARLASLFVRERVDSVRETDMRLVIVQAGLPEPEVNATILADDGTFLARGDLVYRDWRVIVEYDGWHHERDARQRQKDLWRRERLEAAGWTVIVVTAADLEHRAALIARVWEAMRRGGYAGPAPVYIAKAADNLRRL